MKIYRLLLSRPDPYGDDEAARRGEDPPTKLDGILRLLAAVGHTVCAVLCFVGMTLFTMDAGSTGKSLSIIVFGTMGAGFLIFAGGAFRRGCLILFGRRPAPCGFEIESKRDEH